MKTKTLLNQLMLMIALGLFAQTASAQSPSSQSDSIIWQKTFGGNKDETATSINAIAHGGSIVAGYTNSSNSGDVSANHGMNDYWLMNLDASGQLRWKKLLGGSSDDQAQAVKETANGSFIVAGSSASANGDVTGNHGSQDFWIVELDSLGNIQWQKSYGGSGADVPYAMDVTSDGGCIVAGVTYSSNGNVTGNHSSGDYWIIKLDVNGNLQWQKSYGGTALDFAHAIAQSRDGGFLVSGFARSTDGDVLVNHGQEDMWILKLDQNGSLLWQKTFGGTGGEGASSAQQTFDGGYILAGVTHSYNVDVVGNHGVHDFWVVKIDSLGNLQWKECVGGSQTDDGNAVQQTNDGGFIVTGLSDSNDGNATQNHGSHDFWLVKLRSNGSVEWQKSLGGSGADEAFGISQTSDGNFEAAGYTYSNDIDVIGNHGSSDVWVVKVATPLQKIFYADEDGDGYGNPNKSILGASAPPGYVAEFSDCNDQNANVHPGVSDVCNGIDDDCDSYIDEDGLVAAITPLATVTICSSSSLTLKCTNVGAGITYQWMRDGGVINGATNATNTVNFPGSYSVIISNGLCTSNSPTTIVKISMPSATITPAGIVQTCPKNEVSFSVPFITAMNYQWKNDFGIIPGETNMKYTPSVPGNYFVTETDITGCVFNSSVSTLQNYPVAKASISVTNGLILCTTGSVIFNALKKSGYTYQWYKDGNAISGATGTSYNATQAGNYKYLATTLNGCSAFSSMKTVSDCKQVSEDEESEFNSSFSLYPNPTHNLFNVELHSNKMYTGPSEIRIYNSLGQIILAQEAEVNEGAFSMQLTLPDEVKQGLYFVQCLVDEQKYSSSLVVTR